MKWLSECNLGLHKTIQTAWYKRGWVSCCQLESETSEKDRQFCVTLRRHVSSPALWSSGPAGRISRLGERICETDSSRPIVKVSRAGIGYCDLSHHWHVSGSPSLFNWYSGVFWYASQWQPETRPPYYENLSLVNLCSTDSLSSNTNSMCFE